MRNYLNRVMQKIVVPTAARAARAATIARALSKPPMPARTGAPTVAAGRWVGRAAGTEVAGAAAAAARGAEVAGAAGAAVAGAAGAAVAGAGNGAEPGAAEGPPGGSVGNLIVGAAEGFGGRLMRTVSFLG